MTHDPDFCLCKACSAWRVHARQPQSGDRAYVVAIGWLAVLVFGLVAYGCQ